MNKTLPESEIARNLKFKVMIVDREEHFRVLLSKEFEKFYMQCTINDSSADLSSVIDRYKSIEPDLVFIDLDMLGEDGIAPIKQLWSNDKGARLILSSNRHGDGLLPQVYRCKPIEGAYAWVTKIRL